MAAGPDAHMTYSDCAGESGEGGLQVFGDLDNDAVIPALLNIVGNQGTRAGRLDHFGKWLSM